MSNATTDMQPAKGGKRFKIIISILLGITVLATALLYCGFFTYAKMFVHDDDYGFMVTDIIVTRSNKDDILGDGTVSYSPSYNRLTFNNAVIEHDSFIIYSETDLQIELIGENKFICKDGSYIPAIYAGNGLLTKSLFFEGPGSLTIEYENISSDVLGIFAQDLIVAADITIITPDCPNTAKGIACYSSLLLRSGANITVINGAAANNTGVFVRGNVIFEPDSSLNITVNPGSSDVCHGLKIDGDLLLDKNAALSVTVDDESATWSKCISASGAIDISSGSTVTATAQKANAIECYGAIKVNEGAAIAAETAGENADIFCYGAVVNYGGTVDGEVDALGGVHNRAQ